MKFRLVRLHPLVCETVRVLCGLEHWLQKMELVDGLALLRLSSFLKLHSEVFLFNVLNAPFLNQNLVEETIRGGVIKLL